MDQEISDVDMNANEAAGNSDEDADIIIFDDMVDNDIEGFRNNDDLEELNEQLEPAIVNLNGDNENANIVLINMIPEENETDDEEIDAETPPPEIQVEAALDGIFDAEMSQHQRNTGSNFDPEMRQHQPNIRSNFMQRLRRAIFSMDHANSRSVLSALGRAVAVDEQEMADIENIPQEEDEEEEREESPPPPDAIRFDTSLPAEHTYLGDNLSRVSGVNYLDVGQTHCIMLFVHQYLLFPGEILPFMTHDSIMELDFESANGALFGVCFPFLCKNEEDDTLYGVTCQIYEKGHDERHNIVIKSRALQRFVTKRSSMSGTLQHLSSHPMLKCKGNVRILPEIFLPEPLKCIHMGSMARFRDMESMKPLYKRYQASSTPWPVHVFDYYSIDTIVEQARTQLAQHKIDNMPTDPIQLSYWLIRNLHMSEDMMNKAFLTDSVNIRLKLIATTFKEAAIFRCRFCNSHIANCRELFAMSKYGVQSQYCNSAGYIHETNTVYQCIKDAISYSGEPSTEYSWFPGYQWHIICCRICYRHLGWEFKAVEPNLVPKLFYGISSSNVRVSNTMTTAGNPRDVIYRLMRMSQASMR